MKIEVSRTVESSAACVWDVAADLDAATDVISAIESVELLAGPSRPIDLGTCWRETRTMFGRSATEEMTVTDLQAGRSYTVEADGSGAHYVSVISVVSLAEDRATLTMSFRAEPQGRGSRILANTAGRLFVGATRKALQGDLDDIAAAAEHIAAS